MHCSRKLLFCAITWLLPAYLTAQATTGSLGGMVKTAMGEPLPGVTVRLLHEPTATLFFSQTNRAGIFHMDNLSPGGPYSLEITFAGYHTEKRQDIFINLGEPLQVDFFLVVQFAQLEGVTVSATRKTNVFTKNNAIILDREKMEALPSAGRNLHDYLAAVPYATLRGNNEGAISFAGQNNRYNAFFVDGAVNNDAFGLSASGTNGGQAGISPLSIDAIEQFQVAITPYDASIGNFTGAAINAITRSGTNRSEASVYYFFSNQYLAGSIPLESKPGEPGRAELFSKTYGMRWQGAIRKNRFFYFINTELQRELYPQTFAFSNYTGDTKNRNILSVLANHFRATYRYDAGSFLNNPSPVNTDRIAGRFDWNIHNRHKLTASMRYTYGQRTWANRSTPITIHSANDGFALFTTTWSGSLEWKTIIGKHAGNKLAVTYTDVTDDRAPSGMPFPRVRINDGAGAFIFGTDISSTTNLLLQKNYTLSDKLSFTAGKHAWSLGWDMEYNRVFNAFIQNSFGSYTYASVSDFLSNAAPSAYQLGFSLTDTAVNDHTAAAAKFTMMRGSVFINDVLRLSDNCILSYGIRADQYHFFTKPLTSGFINDTAIPVFSRYWDVQVNPSGRQPVILPSFSPRIGCLYKIPSLHIILRAGMGIFSGRIPLAWPGGVYNYNGISIGGYMANASQLNHIRFRPDPYRQWQPAETGAVINKEPLNLLAAGFRMPSLFRASFAAEKKYQHEWSLITEAVFSKNISEIFYTNINLLPPADHAAGADNRSVYSQINNARIPLYADGSNPYDYAILLGNNQHKKGYAYDLTATIKKRVAGKWNTELAYHFGRSVVVTEGTNAINVSQWRMMETINGRNSLVSSLSDFSVGHRIFVLAGRKFRYRRKTMATTVSVSYTGQSGAAFSYVYGYSSIIRDDGRTSGYDLMYIPTAAELAGMVFLPNTVNEIIYSPQQQKEALDIYLDQYPYLKNHRGRYAERNGSRTPFTHILDIKLVQDLLLIPGNRQCRLQLTVDLFNMANLLNEQWGKRYLQPNDNFALVDFAGFTGPGLTPQYRFNPTLLLSEPWKISTANAPAYSSRWNCQLGIRITF